MSGTPVLLDCLHTATFDPWPREGEEVYCRACQDWRFVMASHQSWSLRCSACPLARSYGTDEHQTRRAAIRHANKYVGHVVKVRKGGHVVSNIGSTDGSTTDIIEWLNGHPNHQSRLRSIVTKS